MSKQNIEESVESRVCFEELEDWVREKIQGWVQELLEEEVTELLACQNHLHFQIGDLCGLTLDQRRLLFPAYCLIKESNRS